LVDNEQDDSEPNDEEKKNNGQVHKKVTPGGEYVGYTKFLRNIAVPNSA
jgi:hypothetical protein